MNLFLFFSLLVTAYAHGSCPGGDCLAACRSCAALENDGEENANGTSVFDYGCKHAGDCKEAICKEGVMIVDGHQYPRVVCFQGKWHFGYPDFLEETTSASCLFPGNFTCDPDAEVTYVDDNFDCVCKPPYVDRSAEFELDNGQVCSTCENKKLNIILLVDNSGSMSSVLDLVKRFIATFVQFLKVKSTGNHITLVTSSWSYKIEVDWSAAASTDATQFLSKVTAIGADGQSYLGSGMEAVKAALVQPFTKPTDGTYEEKLIVFTDGSVKHRPPHIKDITTAANNFEQLGVETFVVATNNVYTNKASAIANGVDNNVFVLPDDDAIFDIANKLQKRVCV